MKQKTYEIDGKKVMVEMSPEFRSMIEDSDIEKICSAVALEQQSGELVKLGDGSWVKHDGICENSAIVAIWDTRGRWSRVLGAEKHMVSLYLSSCWHGNKRRSWG